MAERYLLSGEDRDALRAALEAVRRAGGLPPGSHTHAEGPGKAPDVFVIRTPPSGVPAPGYGETGTGTGYGTWTGTGTADEPGAATCDVYRFVRDQARPRLELAFTGQEVLNVGPEAVPGNSWAIAWRERFGEWVTFWPGGEGGGCCSGSASVTLGGTQTSYAPPQGADVLLVTPSSAVTFASFDLPAGWLRVVNTSATYAVTISSSAADTPGGGAVTLGENDWALLWSGGSGTVLLAETTGAIHRPPQTATISSSVDDYPVGPNVTEIVLTFSGDRDVTGFTAGQPGQTLRVRSSPSSTGVGLLIDGDSGSAAVNRLATPGGEDFPLTPGKHVDLTYDGATSLWAVRQPAVGFPWTPTIGASQNDYAVPQGAFSLAPTLTGAYTLTGLSGLPVGTPFAIVNPGSNGDDWTLANLSGSSSAANQFSFSTAADVTLSPGKAVIVMNDGAKVRDLAGSLSLAGGGGGSGVEAHSEGTLAAAGSVQGDAAQIVTERVRVTDADNTKGVILPSVEGGMVFVWNDSANSLYVYPPSGQEISGAGSDVPELMSLDAVVAFVRVTGTQWTRAGWSGV